MVDTATLTKELTGLIGLYPSLNGGGDLPAVYHRSPEVYLQAAHQLLRPEILQAVGPKLSEVSPQGYKADTPYLLYDLVVDETSENGAMYECIQPNTGQPLANTDYWRKTTALSAWYGRIERDAITKLVLLASSAPPTVPLLDNQALFSREGNASDTLNRSTDFKGWQIVVNGRDTVLPIIRLSFQFTGTLTNFPIYLFHSTQNEPIATFLFSGTSVGRSLWLDIPKEFLYQRVGGYYLLGYFAEDLPNGTFAIGSQRPFTIAGCGGCGGGIDAALYDARAPYITIQPIYVPNPSQSGLMTWDDTSHVQISSQSWGLNMVISAKCDATKAVLDNKELFTQALLYMIAGDVLQNMATNDRVNGIAKNMTSQAYIALNGQKENNDFGIKGERKAAISDLKDALSKISSCLPAAPRKGISFGSVWDD
ncbi:hypothetical protein [Spirosoma litoris]